MPLTRYQIRNEYGLADPDLYKAAERDDPEALLEGVAMAGLVGVLRQLGDLAEFAAEIFHDLHEEVMATAARGHGLVARVQQLEADFPSIEKAFLSQTSHSPFFSAPGVDWHPNLHSKQNLVTRGDLPRFVMDSYEECRGPPRLFLLDKFDVAGAGACLKRYTDPSFFKAEARSPEVPTGDVQREKKTRKVKKKAARMKNGETSGIAPTSHAKLHQLLLEERIENGYSDPARAVKLKKRQLNGYPFDSETGKSYMVKFAEIPSPEHKVVHEVPASPPRLKFRSNNTSEIAIDVLEINTVNHVRKSPQRNEPSYSPPYAPEVLYKPSIDELEEEFVDKATEAVPELSSDGETDEIPSSHHEVMDKKIFAVGEGEGEGGKDGNVDGYPSDDVTSEVDNYMDALTTMESEMETDNEHRVKNDMGFLNLEKHGIDSDAYEEQLEFQTHLADSQSVGNSSASDDYNSSFKKGISTFSHSDALSNLTEDAQSDGDRADRITPSNEVCIAESMEALPNKLSRSEILELKSDKLEVSNDTFIEEVKIPDTRETSPSNKLSTSGTLEPKTEELEVPNDMYIEEVRIPVNGATSCVSAELVETLSDCTRFGTKSSDPDETETNLADSVTVLSSIPSQNGDHTLLTTHDEADVVDKLDDGGQDVNSDAPLLSSNVSEDAHKIKGSDYSGNEVLQVIDPAKFCAGNFDSGEIGSPSSVSPSDEQLLCSALPEVEACSVNMENLAPMVDNPETCSPPEEQLSGIPDDVPQHETNLDAISNTVDGQGTDSYSCDADDVGREEAPLELRRNYSSYADREDGVNLGAMITEGVQAEDVALSSASTPDDDVSGVISSSSGMMCSPGNHASSQECLSDLGDQHQKGLELNEEISPGCLVDSEVQREINQLEVVPPDSDLAPRRSVSYKESNLEIIDDAEDVSEAEKDQNGLHVGDVTTASLPSQLGDQVSEPTSPQPDNLIGDSEDASPSSTSGLQEMGAPLQQFSRLQIDQVHIKNFLVDKEQIQSPTCKDLELCFDVSRSSPENLLYPDTSFELSKQSTNGELDVAGKAIDASPASCLEDLPQSSIREADGEKQAIVLVDPSLPNFGVHSVATEVCHSAESCPDNHQRQLLSSELVQPASQGNQETKQAMNQLDTNLPFFGLFPEATPDHLEMPPLPPLPPMQWRMGKVHNAPFASLRESVQCSQDSCNPLLSSAADEKVESGFLLESGVLQPQNLFVPHTAVEDERSQQNFAHLDGNSVQLTPYSMSNMVNDLAREDRQSPNAFLTMPTISDDRAKHSSHNSGGEMIQSSYISPPLLATGDTTSRQGNQMQPLNQLATETSANAKILQHSSEDLEGQGDTSLYTFAPSQSLEDEQPQNGLATTGGEIAWYPKSSAFVSSYDVPKSNGMKIPRPRSPLIDAVAAHDKSTLRKVTERVRPQIEPKVDERDSLLEQIRTKSFNLKPAVVTRPSIQGPKTNLKVAAILEKANAIRQALAGSDDDDDDADSWSDS